MSDHAAVKDEHRKLASQWFRTPDIDSEQESVWTELVAQLLADAIRDARLKEAEWWDARRKIFSTVPENVYKEHMEQLKRGEA